MAIARPLRNDRAYAIITASKRGDTLMEAPQLGSGGFKAGSVAFLVLALLLAVFSGDLMLVLAVATAVGGVFLLGAHRSLNAERRPVARQTPVPQPAAPRPVPVRHQPVTPRQSRPIVPRSTPSARMAIRRSPAPSAPARAHSRAAHTTVADAPSQVQVIQVLQ